MSNKRVNITFTIRAMIPLAADPSRDWPYRRIARGIGCICLALANHPDPLKLKNRDKT
jgi:hypothetical protein